MLHMTQDSDQDERGTEGPNIGSVDEDGRRGSNNWAQERMDGDEAVCDEAEEDKKEGMIEY